MAQHTAELLPDLALLHDKQFRALVTELEFRPDPVLVQAAPLHSLIVNAKIDIRFIAAMVYAAAFTSLAAFPFPEFCNVLLSSGVLEKLIEVNQTGMIVKGHIKPGDLKILRV